jgi:hypothetical protein
MTMLEATSEANNRNAYDLAIKHYKDAMNTLTKESYVKEEELSLSQDGFYQESIDIFSEIATMGSDLHINDMKSKLIIALEAEKKRFYEVNSLKNPYRDMEYYILPIMIGIVSYILSKFIDKACSTDVRYSRVVLSFLSFFVSFFPSPFFSLFSFVKMLRIRLKIFIFLFSLS